MKAKCPNPDCQKTLTTFPYEAIDIGGSLQTHYKAVSVFCPHCRTSLGLLVDPVALVGAVAGAVVARLKGN